MRKKKYIVYFLTKQQGIYTIQKKKRIKPSIETISFRNKTYFINIEIPIFTRKLKIYYFIDLKEGQLFLSENIEQAITPEIADSIICKHIIRQITSNLVEGNFKMNLLYIIFGIAIGGLIGYIAGGFVSV